MLLFTILISANLFTNCLNIVFDIFWPFFGIVNFFGTICLQFLGVPIAQLFVAFIFQVFFSLTPYFFQQIFVVFFSFFDPFFHLFLSLIVKIVNCY